MAELRQILVDLDVNRAIEANRQSFSESENDILRRMVLKASEAANVTVPVAALVPVTDLDPPQFGSRKMGHWQAGLLGKVVAATSLKDAYCKYVLLAHQHDGGFLGRYAKLKGKTRRFVARVPQSLYLKSPHLAKDHAIELIPGWFVDGNLSESQIGQRVRAAARELGIAYGKDAWIREATRTI